jgi:CelD/BcsL family acetyltransferase involved in cellulose biosynthesis
MLTVTQLSGLHSFMPLIPAWEALDATKSPRTPFSTPLWNMLWWMHLRGRQRSLWDEFHSFAVFDPSGALVAIAPMMLTHRPATGPMRVRKLQFFGADPFITEVRGLISDPSHQAAATKAIIDHLHRRPHSWDWVEWFDTPDPSAAEDRIVPGAPFKRRTEIPDYFLRLPATWEEQRSGLPPNTKEALRKCYKSLQRGGHRFRLRVIERPEEVPAALAIFFRLHTARAQATEGLSHRDVFTQSHTISFLTAYARRMSQRGQLRVFHLEVDGDIVATRIGFIFANEIYLYYSGFDPAWAKHNVMTTLMAETIKWAIEQRFAILNLSTGEDRSKTRWRPNSVTSGSETLISPAWRGQMAHWVYEDLLTRRLAAVLPRTIVAYAQRQHS